MPPWGPFDNDLSLCIQGKGAITDAACTQGGVQRNAGFGEGVVFFSQAYRVADPQLWCIREGEREREREGERRARESKESKQRWKGKGQERRERQTYGKKTERQKLDVPALNRGSQGEKNRHCPQLSTFIVA